MKLVKGKISFIRSILACIIFPLVFGYFYSYVMDGSNWFEVNQSLGIVLIVLLGFRGYFEFKVAKNKTNVKITAIAAISLFLYTMIRFIR